MRALVLDDNLAIGRLVRAVATPLGFATELTSSGTEFRSRYRAALPDAILLDLQIGDGDGSEELRFLAGEGYRNPLVLMNGADDRVLAAAEQLAHSLGLDPVAALSKPVRSERLAQVLVQIRETAKLLSRADVLEAVRQNQLVLEYQPIVAGDRTQLRWLEALVRWDHPEHGRLPPDRFIPVAERSVEAIDALTDWVVAAAADEYARLRRCGFIAPMAVNISGRNLDDVSFPDRVHDRLHAAGVPAGHFCVELTESAAAMKPSQTMEILSRMRRNGVQLALDDFGTGYSSLKQLRQLPFSALKIDRSFVADVATSRDSRAIVKSTIDLARNMELESIAEGVESEAMAGCLAGLHVDAVQGYLIARPLPADQVAGWLAQQMRAAS
jgi:EAL domain-containing protein (putative c-di-GMP-specific phosphodiesterase class I)